ncbi:chaperonin GroEL, partial [candidate division WWE3 bacterium]|nr:chaperonin GroEL [candidate division WWE3 bacterium]
RIMFNALEAPIRQLASNAGFDAGWVTREVDQKEGDTGFNVMTGEFTSMLENGILDPVRVTRTAVENAASVAINILTTEALIADIKDDKDDAAAAAMAGGMGGGMPGMM